MHCCTLSKAGCSTAKIQISPIDVGYARMTLTTTLKIVKSAPTVNGDNSNSSERRSMVEFTSEAGSCLVVLVIISFGSDST